MVATTSKIELKKMGTVQPRSAGDISDSSWSIGTETMDRDYTVYENWREYLGPLGIKRARLQSGWSKTEKEPGVYDWRWLDEIIPDMHDQGVIPWMCLCYGNAAYQSVEGIRLGAKLPETESVLAAWERFVRAFVTRYGTFINEWEIWNEPNGGKNPPERYAEYFMRTARTVRQVQPEATILALALAGAPSDYARGFFESLRENDCLDLVDEVTYHPYAENPDSVYDRVAALRSVANEFVPDAIIRQGENGAPSEQHNGGALRKYPWTELSHTKWALRRLLGDLGRDIPSSYFCMMDMKYDHGWKDDRPSYEPGAYTMYTYGVLKANLDKTVAYAKPSYKAIQNLAAIFDSTLMRIPEYAYEISAERSTSLFAYKNVSSERNLVSYWYDDDVPSDSMEIDEVDLTFRVGRLSEPVLVDLLLGDVYEIPYDRQRRSGSSIRLAGMPIQDSPLLIADKSLIGLIRP